MGIEGAPLDPAQRRRPVITGADEALITGVTIKYGCVPCVPEVRDPVSIHLSLPPPLPPQSSSHRATALHALARCPLVWYHHA
jgi:hypothetical protein